MKKALLALLLLSAAQSAVGDAKTDYLLYCRGCHLANGAGVPPEVPTLVKEVGKLIALPGGREYIVRVPGVAQTDMDDAALAAVLNWVISEFNAATVPKEFVPYTAAYVGTVRSKILTDPLRARAELVSTKK